MTDGGTAPEAVPVDQADNLPSGDWHEPARGSRGSGQKVPGG
jgi:hypothetical protein